MKKTTFALLLMLAAVSVNAQILINEVQYDPIGSGTDTKTEWIELYNPTSDDIDLSGWLICDNTDSVGEAVPSTVLAAGEYLVLAAVIDSFHLNFPGVPALNWPDSSIGSGLSNTGDMLVLLNSSLQVIDKLNYGTVNTSWASWVKFGGWDPGAVDPSAGHSIGRSPNGFDSNLAADWADMATATPGATNGGAVVYTPHTIYDIQFGGGLTDSSVSVVGIVTSRNLAGAAGFMLGEAPGPWHGVTVYGTSVDALRGDSVLINGTVSEFNGLTELIPSQVTILGTGSVPALTDVALADVKTGSGTAESYEGVLVRIPKALACDTTWMSPTFGEWAVCIGPDTLMIDNSSTTNGIYYAKPAFGVDSVRVTGVMTYDNSRFKLMPRDSADVINYGPTGIVGQPTGTVVPARFAMKASPNPANRRTLISFNLPGAAEIELSIFNIAGQKVATLAKGSMNAGAHSVEWKAGDAPNGVYFYQLMAGGRTLSQKIVVVR